nr:hypothetical protein [Tanacetum cinerariifolium]
IDGFKLGIGVLTGAAMGSETGVSDWVTGGSVPDSKDEAMLELMNLDIISVRLANCGTVLVRDSTALTGAGVGDVAGAEDWFFLSRSNALTMSLSSATSDEMAGVEELKFTLATTSLARDCQTFDLLSMIFKQSEGILFKKLPPAAEFNES